MAAASTAAVAQPVPARIPLADLAAATARQVDRVLSVPLPAASFNSSVG